MNDHEEKTWFYLVNSTERHGPVSDSEMASLITEGVLKKGDLIWREGMDDWVPIQKFPTWRDVLIQARPDPAAGPPQTSLGKWMNFVGVTSIIYGIFHCITCVNLLIGIAIIIAGSALLSARQILEELGEPEERWLPFFQKLTIFMKMMGIAYIIMIAMFICLGLFWLIGVLRLYGW